MHRVEALTQELEELREMHYKIKGQYADMEAEFEKFREQSRRELEELQGERRDHVGHVEALKAKASATHAALDAREMSFLLAYR